MALIEGRPDGEQVAAVDASSFSPELYASVGMFVLRNANPQETIGPWCTAWQRRDDLMKRGRASRVRELQAQLDRSRVQTGQTRTMSR